ncbi:MAG: TldD/PmbA family protein [Clostridia bacterium]|nr:TldD/PmbA family protein [Clostridia bacterium]MBN2882055.1 TldD/PmbA family protein [Clostridia bacterium]
MISKNVIASVLEAAVSTGGDFAELFIEDSSKSSLNYLDGQLESSQTGRDFGVGIRIFSGLNCIYAYTNSFDQDSLVETALKAAQAVRGSVHQGIKVLNNMKTNRIHVVEIMPDSVSKKDKLDIVKTAYNSAIAYDSLIKQVSSRYSDTVQNVAIANTEGLYREDTRVYTRLMINAVAEKNGQMQTGSANPGSHGGYEFIQGLDLNAIARSAAATAVVMVNAEYCKAGVMPVVIDNAFGGVIFHEACGHGLEATSVAKGTSVFAGKIGEKVAPEVVTAIDDGTMPNEWGSTNMDDEGSDTRRNVLIEKGILKGYLVDRFNGRKMGMESTGSSRRESYKFAPTSRMSNTFIDNGHSKKEEIISSVDFGLYAKVMGGGSVNPGTGEFNFSVREGYMIRNGKIAEPVRGGTLIGKGPDVLQKIDMVADNLDMDQGMCGSSSGSVPANVGQPAVRVSSITVGGR